MSQITNTKVILYDSEKHLLITDKYTQIIEADIDLYGTYAINPDNVVYDKTNQKLWIGAVGKIIRFAAEQDSQTGNFSLTHEATITLTGFYASYYSKFGRYFDVRQKTGDLYIANFNIPDSYSVWKVPMNQADSSAIDPDISSYTISPEYTYRYTPWVYFDNIHDKLIIVMSQIAATTTSTADYIDGVHIQRRFAMYTYDPELVTLKQHFPISNKYIFTSVYGVSPNQIVYNPINNRIYFSAYVYFSDFTPASYMPVTIKITSDVSGQMLDIDMPDKYKYSIGVGEKTGNIYKARLDTGYLEVLDFKEEEIFTKTFSDNTNYFTTNPISEDMYRIVENVVKVYDRFGTLLSTSDNLNKSISFVIVIPGSNEVAPYAVSPNKIVYPSSPTYIATSTPTIAFAPGVSPVGWTQQFRICMDRDLDKIINGDENTVYEKAVDSWASGDKYDSTWNFQYSEDYNPGNNPAASGTWNNLGTEDGLHVSGIMPQNGILKDSSDTAVYVKFTVPTSNALAGVDTGDSWYIKIYSYSVPNEPI